MTRYYGWYANRPRGTRRKATTDAGVAPITVAEPEALPLREARRRWAELLRRIYEVDPLTCPACGGAMRILAFLTERAVTFASVRSRARRAGPPVQPARSIRTPPRCVAGGLWCARRGEPHSVGAADKPVTDVR